jgi:hypothetical protein
MPNVLFSSAYFSLPIRKKLSLMRRTTAAATARFDGVREAACARTRRRMSGRSFASSRTR